MSLICLLQILKRKYGCLLNPRVTSYCDVSLLLYITQYWPTQWSRMRRLWFPLYVRCVFVCVYVCVLRPSLLFILSFVLCDPRMGGLWVYDHVVCLFQFTFVEKIFDVHLCSRSFFYSSHETIVPRWLNFFRKDFCTMVRLSSYSYSVSKILVRSVFGTPIL